MRGFRNACKILVRKPEGKSTLEKSRHRWENGSWGNGSVKLWTGCSWLRVGTSGGLL